MPVTVAIGKVQEKEEKFTRDCKGERERETVPTVQAMWNAMAAPDGVSKLS